MQLGRSVYSGEKIDLNELDKKYDIDHIIPQAKLKDDSFNNMVLVERELNNKNKTNILFLQQLFLNKVKMDSNFS